MRMFVSRIGFHDSLSALKGLWMIYDVVILLKIDIHTSNLSVMESSFRMV